MNFIKYGIILKLKEDLSVKRTRLADRILPTYTKGEEIFNMVSHIVGASLGVVAIVLGIVFSVINQRSYGIASSIVYGSTLIILYTMSSIYHGLNPRLKAKKVFQVIDHCSIFLLIAGTYTPFTLCTLREYNPVLGWTIFGVVWGLAIIGIVLNSIDLKKYKLFSMICYLVMGWCIIVRINVIMEALGGTGFTLLLLGGIVYTLGAIFYGFGKKKKWMHSVFHLACVIASLLQLICVLVYVI